MLTLAVDTSANNGTLSLFNGEKIVSTLTIDIKRTHSETLLDRIGYLLKESEVDFSQIGAFLGILGPGSFTGIRIGVTALKTLAFSLDKQLLGVSSLRLLAFHCVPLADFYNKCYTVIPGIRDELYLGEYRISGNFPPETVSEKLIIRNRLADSVGENSVIFINSHKISEFMNELKNVRIMENTRFPETVKYIFNDIDSFKYSPADFNPVYLRESEAELAYRKKKQRKYQLYIENLWN